MAALEIALGAIWVLLGVIMLYSGLFDRSIVPAPLARTVRLPFAMIGGAAWLMRFGLRATVGGSRKAKASR